MKVKRLSKEDFDYIYSRVPRVCVDLAVITKQGIVLTKRKIPPYIGMWHTPGGTVLKGETMEQAVQRVAMDEIGVVVKIGELIGINDILRDGNTGRHTVSVVYKVIPTSTAFEKNEQSDEIQVFSKYPKNMIPLQKRFLSSRIKLQ